MKKWLFLNLIIASTLILGACSTSNSVVSNKLISKRKYTKGFHINKKTNLKDSDETLAAQPLSEERVDKTTRVKSNKNKKSTKKAEPKTSSVLASETNTRVESSEENLVASTNFNDSDQLNFESEESNDFVAESNEVSSRPSNEDTVQSVENAAQPDMSDPLWLIIMILLALILPPVAIAIYSGITGIFWLDLILFLLAISSFFWMPLFGLAGLAAVIIAFLVIFDVI